MSKIVWIDMEMTGLNVHRDRIMEIACLITDNQLNVLAEHPTIVINQPDSLLNAMDDWCTKTHTEVNIKFKPFDFDEKKKPTNVHHFHRLVFLKNVRCRPSLKQKLKKQL